MREYFEGKRRLSKVKNEYERKLFINKFYHTLRLRLQLQQLPLWAHSPFADVVIIHDS